MILEDDALDTAVADSSSVEDIAYAEIACELVLKTLARWNGVCFLSFLVACDEEFIKKEVVCGIIGDAELELIAVLGSGIASTELCPFTCGCILGIEFYSCFPACFLVDDKK